MMHEDSASKHHASSSPYPQDIDQLFFTKDREAIPTLLHDIEKKLHYFSLKYDADFTVSQNINGKEDFLKKLIQILIIVYNMREYFNQEKDYYVWLYCLNCLRICLRNKSHCESILNGETLDIVIKSCSKHSVESMDAGVHIMAMRCLTNLLFEDEKMYSYFNKLKGMDRIFTVLSQEAPSQLVFYSVRFLYMVISQRPLALQDLVHDDKHVDMLCLTMMYTFRATSPPFPYGESRIGVFKDLSKLLYAIFAMSHKESIMNTLLYNPEFNAFLFDVVICPMYQLNAVYDCKILALQHIMLRLANREMIHAVAADKGRLEEVLISLLHLLNITIIKEEHKGYQSASMVSTIVPILAILTEFAITSKVAHGTLFDIIVKQSYGGKFEFVHHDISDHQHDHTHTKNIQPRVAPAQFSTLDKVLKLMTSVESHTKRYASELVFAICNKDESKFIELAGFGNAVGLLRAMHLGHDIDQQS